MKTGIKIHTVKRVLTKKEQYIRTQRRTKPDSMPRDLRTLLKIKIKSLTNESRIIREQEKVSWGMMYNKLHLHRVTVVRSESRHAQLAYAYIRGKRHEDIEQKHKAPQKFEGREWKHPSRIDADSVARMVNKYGQAGVAFHYGWLTTKREDNYPVPVLVDGQWAIPVSVTPTQTKEKNVEQHVKLRG